MAQPMTVATPISMVAILRDICRGCVLTIASYDLTFALILRDISNLKIIIGMDRLFYSRAYIYCHRRRVIFFTPFDDIFLFISERCSTPLLRPIEAVIRNIWAEGNKVVVGKYPRVVREFLDVFSDRLLGRPPLGWWNSKSISCTAPIYTAYYHTAPAELTELQKQIVAEGSAFH